ncbi:MAG: Clp protease N-terminal domain-containing protein [Rubrobacteraceae bacterium]
MIFNRFVKESRKCAEAAVEEARSLGHDSVGDEDLLLGILRTDDEVAAQALSSLGVTPEAVREQSEALLSDALSSIGISLEEARLSAGETFDMRLPDARRIPFSPRAKKALEQALSESLRVGDNRITPEHVLLGILRNTDGTAVRILSALNAPVSVVEERLDQLRGRTYSG